MRAVISIGLAAILLLCGCRSATITQSGSTGEFILIDPGHGGVDGGTIAEDGTLEKHINLSVALILRDLLCVSGFPVSMTRQTDTSIHDAAHSSTRSIKVSDMKNRLRLYQQSDCVISLHQNHFSAPKYHGAQVFYSGNHLASELLASAIRQSIRDLLQPENNREMKKAGDGIYLLYHTQRPAVLVECGFLSNPQERELLKDISYQQQMAFAIMGGYWMYIKQE